MKKLLCMALSLGLLLPQARAQSLSPAFAASVQFGGHSAPQWHWHAAATQVVYTGRMALAVPVIAVDFDDRHAPTASVLGVSLAAPATVSNLDGERQQSGTSWVWIGLGLGAVAAVAVVAGSGSERNRNESSGNSTCNGVSGDVVGPNPPTVGSGCGSLVSGNGGT